MATSNTSQAIPGLEELKRAAKRIKKTEQITHSAALDRAAAAAGFSNYQHARRMLKQRLSSIFRIPRDVAALMTQRVSRPVAPSPAVMEAIVRIGTRKGIDPNGILLFSMVDLTKEMARTAPRSRQEFIRFDQHIRAALDRLRELGWKQDWIYQPRETPETAATEQPGAAPHPR